MLFCAACSQESEQPTSEGLAPIESLEEENFVTVDDSLPEHVGDAELAGEVNADVDEALLRADGGRVRNSADGGQLRRHQR